MTLAGAPAPGSEAQAEVVGLLWTSSGLTRRTRRGPNGRQPSGSQKSSARWESRPKFLEAARGRADVVARIEGRDPSRGALLVHSHTDVVPAEAAEWSVHPFSGELAGGYLWGPRRHRHEEHGGHGALRHTGLGSAGQAPGARSRARIRRRRGGWRGRGLAIPRTGTPTFSRIAARPSARSVGCEQPGTLNDRARLYLIETAEKGISWLRLRARTSMPGHGSMLHEDNAVTRIAGAVSRIGEHRFPIVLTDTVKELLDSVAELSGIGWDGGDPGACLAQLGGFARMVGASLRNTANPTMLAAARICDKRRPLHRRGDRRRQISARARNRTARGARPAGGTRGRAGQSHPRHCRGDLVRRLRSSRRWSLPCGPRTPLPTQPLYLLCGGTRHEVVLDPRHPVFRLHAAHAARRTWTSGAVPRDRQRVPVDGFNSGSGSSTGFSPPVRQTGPNDARHVRQL